MALLLVVYPACAYPVLRSSNVKVRDALFAALNVAMSLAVCCKTAFPSHPELRGSLGALLVLVYLCVVIAFYAVLKASSLTRFSSQAAMLFPVAALIVYKLLPFAGSMAYLRSLHTAEVDYVFIGMSYLSFRVALLAQEVRNGVVEMPSLAAYLAFAFYLPTLLIGPISPYSYYASSIGRFDRQALPVGRALLRVLVGFTKYRFLAPILGQLTYRGLLSDGHPHHLMDFWVALFVYPIYLYNNFSGFCDIAIGISGLLGIRVMENFDHPFDSRNYQEFWSRWHMSLSFWFRDMLFTPLTKALIRIGGPKRAAHCTAASIIIVFMLLALWHTVSWSFVLFGLSQGIGVASVFYWTAFLKRRLGKASYEALRNRKAMIIVGRVATYVYFAFSTFFFANSITDMVTIFRSLR